MYYTSTNREELEIYNELVTSSEGYDGKFTTQWADIIDIGSHLFSIDWNGSQHNIYLDSNVGTYISVNTPVQLNSRQFTIARRPPLSIFDFNDQIQEIILYASDQSSNLTGIETNINDFYSIY